MLYVDTKTWLPDDLLVKADKMTMANSLELRVPLLDHLVLEFAAMLPVRFKVRGMVTKRILKEAFKDKIPQEIINRRKTGLPVPLKKWMRNDLKGYIREVLLGEKSLHRGYFRKSAIEDLIQKQFCAWILDERSFFAFDFGNVAYRICGLASTPSQLISNGRRCQ